MIRFSSVLLLFCSICAICGCGPTIVYRIDTKVAEDDVCKRNVIILSRPNERFKGQRVNLKDYLDFPSAEEYEKFVMTPTRAVFSGRFASPADMPCDFMKLTPDTSAIAKNRVRYRMIDLVLVKIYEYEEQFCDIVDRKEGARQLQVLVGIALDAVVDCLNELYGHEHDLSGFEKYLRDTLPGLADRLYSDLWEIRRAQRSGISPLSEGQEWRQRILDELERVGIPVGDFIYGKSKEDAREKLAQFLDGKLAELTRPLREDVNPLDGSFVRSKEAGQAMLTALQIAVKKKYGSTGEFTRKVEPLIPLIFGAYLPGRYYPIPANPRLKFVISLTLPGHLVQTNGMRNLAGGVEWSCSEENMGLTGFKAWARSMVRNEEALSALKLQAFGQDMTSIILFLQEICCGKNGEVNTKILDGLRECVAQSSLAPLAELAGIGKDEAEKKNADSEDLATKRAAVHIHAFLLRLQPVKPASTEPEFEGGQ